MSLVSIREISPELQSLINQAMYDAKEHRGGSAFIDDLCAGRSAEDFLREALECGHIYATDAVDPRAFAIVFDETVHVLYVRKELRRQGVGRSFLNELLHLPMPPKDAVALPGDRATKSLYESVGWKARKLTMRGE